MTQISKSTQLNAYVPDFEAIFRESPSPRNGDFGGSQENRARKPTRGLRLRFRTMLRAAGVTGKFRTDELRNGALIILAQGNEIIKSPVDTFEGRPVRSGIRSGKL